MKKILLLITLTALFSCEPNKKTDYTLISGKIENFKDPKIIIYNQYNYSVVKEIALKEDGSFLDTLKIDATFFVFRQDRNMIPFYAPKGSEIQLKYNATKKDSTLLITGDFNKVNNYIIKKEELTQTEMQNAEELYKKNETDFKNTVNKLKIAQEDLLLNTNGLPNSFKKLESNNINYEYLNNLYQYESAHGYYSKKRDFKASKDFLEELKAVSFENEKDFEFSSFYRDLIRSKILKEAREMATKDSIYGEFAELKITASKIKNETIKNELLYNATRDNITFTFNLEEYYALFLANSTNAENNAKITNTYNELKKLAKGSPSPIFTDYENNAGGTTSLKDLKGKYVYIDVWATWCGPCIEEIPSLKKVEKQFHNKNIEFVSISIDTEDAYDKWKKMIVDKELGGLQLLADKNWQSDFIKSYMIQGIPHFILIDPNGTIVNSNAPRPSDKKLVATLNSLL